MQPISWKPPYPVTTWDVLPLAPAAIKAYLIKDHVENPIFLARTEAFLDETTSTTNPVVQKTATELLSLPYELDLVISLLELGHTPDLIDLHEQQMQLIDLRFRELFGKSLPIDRLGELAYDARLKSSNVVNGVDIDRDTLDFLIENKVLLICEGQQASYLFRHEKLQNYFVFLHFLSERALFSKHSNDVRFAGVFVLATERLSTEDAKTFLAHLAIAGAEQEEFGIVGPVASRLREMGALEMETWPLINTA